MSRLLSSAVSLRRDRRLLRLPPYLSLCCTALGIIWLLSLPLEKHSRRTYISENALLPGQVHTYFGENDERVLRAYQHELNSSAEKDSSMESTILENHLTGLGLKVGRQTYSYLSAGEAFIGENVYGILEAPRGDATEALVFVAARSSIQGAFNLNGIAMTLALARYFKRWSLWSKDIIFLMPEDSHAGTQAWVDAYHDAHDAKFASPLPRKAGALQSAIALDFPTQTRFEGIHILYDGTNGQLPNLDLINTVVSIACGQMGIPTAIQGMRHHTQGYLDRLRTIVRGMIQQGLGTSAGPHSSFIPYHIDAVTLQPYGEGWHDEMAMGRVIEGVFRSLNNLLEHLHQSFFFYLLMQTDRFVSIGTFLPSTMLISASFSIMAIYYWVMSGQPSASGCLAGSVSTTETYPNKSTFQFTIHIRNSAGRDLCLPLCVVASCHIVALVPLFGFNTAPRDMLFSAFIGISVFSVLLPFLIVFLLTAYFRASAHHFQLMKSLSLLSLGMILATLSTLNFSLAFLIGLLTSPQSLFLPTRSKAARLALQVLLYVTAPPVVIFLAAQVWQISLDEILQTASFGWNVGGAYTAIVVWCVWWPNWVLGTTSVLGAASKTRVL